MKKLIVLGTAGAIAAIVVACGGSSSSNKTPTSAAGAKPAATVAATKAAATPAASGTSESTPTTAELSGYITQLKAIMNQVIAKAQSGDVQGTRDTEATMDTAMEATVKATRAVDPALADKLEKLELDIEHQADASTTDLTVIAKDAQAVLPTLDQVATALKLTPAAAGAAPSTAELSADVKQLKKIMADVIAKAQAGDVQGTRDTEGTMDTAMEAVVKATRAVDPALADKLENLELDIEHQADASNTDLSVIIKDAQAVPAVLDQVVTTLKLTP